MRSWLARRLYAPLRLRSPALLRLWLIPLTVLAARHYPGLEVHYAKQAGATPPPRIEALPTAPTTPQTSAQVGFGQSASPVVLENSRPGSSSWRITNYALNGEIEAYAGQMSVDAGNALDFYVSTRRANAEYRIDFYRMGWYGGAGAGLMSSVAGLVGRSQGFYTTATGLVRCNRCHRDDRTGLVDANWLPSYTLHVAKNRVSGVYLALFTTEEGKQTYALFVVRQDARASALILKISSNTYEAYNAWGGKSLYAYNSLGAKTIGASGAAVEVSFNRPFDFDLGAGQFLRYEYNLVRWLERSGYDVTYVVDSDVAASASLLYGHRGFISAGHDEYWTWKERDNVEKALAAGVNLAFLSGDAVYWQARYAPDESGVPDRTLVEYRGSADPFYSSDPARATVRWQDQPVNLPESLLTGTMYGGQTEPFTQDWVVQDVDSWVFTGTGLSAGDHVTGLVGKEFDHAGSGPKSPPGLRTLSRSPVTVTMDSRSATPAYAESTLYAAPSGAIVFSAATVTWSWGLDDASFPLGTVLHNTPVSPAIQRLTLNLLDRFISGPAHEQVSPGSTGTPLATKTSPPVLFVQ